MTIIGQFHWILEDLRTAGSHLKNASVRWSIIDTIEAFVQVWLLPILEQAYEWTEDRKEQGQEPKYIILRKVVQVDSKNKDLIYGDLLKEVQSGIQRLNVTLASNTKTWGQRPPAPSSSHSVSRVPLAESLLFLLVNDLMEKYSDRLIDQQASQSLCMYRTISTISSQI